VVLGFGFFLLHNSVQTEVTELAPSARASSFSLHAFSFFMGQALGPMVYGIALPAIGTTIAFRGRLHHPLRLRQVSPIGQSGSRLTERVKRQTIMRLPRADLPESLLGALRSSPIAGRSARKHEASGLRPPAESGLFRSTLVLDSVARNSLGAS
jgi:hypothetical protein